MKDVTIENDWILELGLGNGIDIPIYVIIGFMQRDQFNQQHQNNDSIIETKCSKCSTCFFQRKFSASRYTL